MAPLVLFTAFCGLIGELGRWRSDGPERREEVTIRLEYGVPICLLLRVPL